MELQIFYMTLQESKEILKKEGYLTEENLNFSKFLKEVGSKSFKEKNIHFTRYDKCTQLLQVLKEKKNWTDPPFMKDDDQLSNSSNKNFESKLSSPIKIVAPPMRHDSLESHERNSESASSHD